MRQKVPDPRSERYRSPPEGDSLWIGEAWAASQEVGCHKMGWFIKKHSEGQVLESGYIPSDQEHHLLPFLFPYIPPPPSSLLPSSFLHFHFISHPTPLTPL